ncbi:DUF4249 domain-containing protein [Rufibacter glacialis]|uniref:DUF4249 domain-containing protein n=1 Tax=Rufibacter glacialis TaxID=1259555 RepID=A0A5M8QKU7_9BACT|nr:DUF4249 domain-containing protein [Rufibacter glacialis]KAA6435386.1 DUF4249 domain-containing protein [Rufibacter glacialis]GGK62962.1 hypothetical protein GCM10011405_08780 [Rufibacter glacialis]
MFRFILPLFSEKHLKISPRLLLGLGLVLGLSACETTVEMDVPAHTPKLAVQYNLNTDAPNQSLIVGRSQPVLASDDLWRDGLVNNAIVTIKDQNGVLRQGFVFKPFEVGITQGSYKPTNGFSPVPGQQYVLSISAPGFEPIEGRLTQPTEVPVVSAAFEPVRQTNHSELRGLLKLQFNDPPAGRNYYRFFLKLYDAQGKLIGSLYSDRENEGILDEEVEQISVGKVFDDGWAKAGVISFSDLVTTYPGNNQTAKYLEVTLQHLTPDLYLYERSRENYTEDNPFAEPLNLHSNIRNGYGSFGGITTTKYRINL